MNQPLFFAPPGHEKVAGYKMPANPRLWQSEIIRYLKSQHPYLPMESSEIDIRRVDATKGAAVGSVILGNEIAVPIISSRPRPGADPELSPMDVFFHKGRYRFLDPEAIKNVTHTPQIGEPESTHKSRAMGGNPYIGDMTGDATPLEYSGQASPFAGPYDGTKVSCDISYHLLPDYMTKEAKSQREKMRDRAALFGTTGAIGGGVRGAITTKGGAKVRAIGALKQSLLGAVAGSAAGAGSVPVGRALGLEKRRRKEQRHIINRVVKREIEKMSALDFSAGLQEIVEDGLVSRLLKHAYLDPNDISNFRTMLATNPHILQGSGHNHKLVEIIARRGPQTTMPRQSIVKNPNMMQVYARQGVVYIKFSGGPETKTTAHELKQILGDRYREVASKLRSGNVHIEHDGVQQVSWDVKRPMSESKHVTRDGLYTVRTQNGESIVGMVCQAIMDLDGKTLPLKLFVTPEGKYAMTGEMFGVRLADRHRLPSQVPLAGQTGVFINYVHGTPISTLPLRLVSIRRSEPKDGDKRTLYIVQEPMTGRKFTLSPVQGVQGFERMHVIEPGIKAVADGPVYYIPGDSEWVELKNPVRLAESEHELKKLSSVDDDTHVYYGSGMFHIKQAVVTSLVKRPAVSLLNRGLNFMRSGATTIGAAAAQPRKFGGAVSNMYRTQGLGATAKALAPAATVAAAPVALGYGASKLSSWNDLNEPGAREILVGMGMDLEGAEATIKAAREHQGIDRGVKISGLHEPQIQGREVTAYPTPTYDQATFKFANDCRPGADLIKAAAESGHPETLDSLLSLEFITPQNLRYFVDNIPDFEEAATRLAALLIAVRLGMPHVPEQPVKDSLEGLSKTINKLQILKSATDHKNERVASAT